MPAVQRIALHLARVHPGTDPSVVLENMTLLGKEELRLEFGELVRDRWHDFGDARSRYLDFVAGGPPDEMLERSDETEQLTRKWRGFYLQPVLDKLDRSDLTVVALLEGADVPEFDVLVRFEFRATMAEHDSPWSAEEMLALDVDGLVDQIKAYTPNEEYGTPSWRGIGETLVSVVSVVTDHIDRYRALPAAVADIAPEIVDGPHERRGAVARID